MLSVAKTMLPLAKSIAIELWKDRRGASMLEYSILIGLIIAVSVATVTAVGGWMSGRWTNLMNLLSPAAG